MFSADGVDFQESVVAVGGFVNQVVGGSFDGNDVGRGQDADVGCERFFGFAAAVASRRQVDDNVEIDVVTTIGGSFGIFYKSFEKTLGLHGIGSGTDGAVGTSGDTFSTTDTFAAVNNGTFVGNGDGVGGTVVSAGIAESAVFMVMSDADRCC